VSNCDTERILGILMVITLNRLAVLCLMGALTACSAVPKPLTNFERSNQSDSDVATLQKFSYLGPDPVLDISDVIARAVIFNSDRELASLQARLAGLDSSQAYLEQLPTLTQRISNSNRTNESGSTSADIDENGQVQPLGDNPSYSTSSPSETTSADLTLAFDVLDFGIAFKRAEQLADQFLLTQEKERQAIQSVYQRAQAAYWRAVAADRLEFELNTLLLKTRDAYETSLEIEKRNLRDPLQSLTFRRELLDVEGTLRDLKRELATARTDLDVLIGVKPGTRYELRDALDPKYPLPVNRLDLASLEGLALLNRSDLAENLYQKRLLETERSSLLLRLLPSFRVNASYNKDFSPYVLNGEYGMFGADVQWDFLNLLRVQPTKVRIQLRERLLEEQRLQITLAALALVQKSDELLTQNLDRFNLAQDYKEVTANVFMQVSAAAQSQRQGALVVLKEELNFLIARHRADLAYSDIQSALSQVVEAAGLDMVPANWDSLSVNELASVIELRRSAWFEHERVEVSNEPAVDLVPGLEREDSDRLHAEAETLTPVAAASLESKEIDGWALQICAFRTRNVVLRFKQDLESIGWQNLYIVEQGGFFKLRQGAFKTKMFALDAKSRLKRGQRVEGLVIRTSV